MVDIIASILTVVWGTTLYVAQVVLWAITWALSTVWSYATDVWQWAHPYLIALAAIASGIGAVVATVAAGIMALTALGNAAWVIASVGVYANTPLWERLAVAAVLSIPLTLLVWFVCSSVPRQILRDLLTLSREEKKAGNGG